MSWPHRRCAAGLLAVVAVSASCGVVTGERDSTTAGPSSIVPYEAPPAGAHDGERFEEQSSVLDEGGAVRLFDEGLGVRIDGVERLRSSLGVHSRDDPTTALVRVDFTYTNAGGAVHRSEGRQQPVRLLHGAARREAQVDPGYEGTSDQLTRVVPTVIPAGGEAHGTVAFAVPVASMGELALLVVEPRRYTEHLFTDVQALLG